MAVTIKDIAERVGKSVTTVSRALHGYDDVSPATKTLVHQVAEELGYTPNTYAQRLQKQRSETIGFIIPTFGPRFSDPFFSEFLAGIGNQAARHDFDLLVSTCPPGEEELVVYRKNVQGRRVDGFIIVRTRQQDARIQYLQQIGFPFVAFGRTRGKLDFPYVDEDSVEGMRQVIGHLISQGHARIALITSPPELNFSQDRLDGFIQALQAANLKVDQALIRVGDLTNNDGYRQARELLNLPQPPSAIVACNDLMALGAINAARERGLTVGRDVAITGFDDIPLAEHASPPLTTVHQPIYKIGTMVCDILVQLINQQPLEKSQILLIPKLVIRQSSQPVQP